MSQSLTHLIKRQLTLVGEAFWQHPQKTKTAAPMAHPLLLQTKNSSYNQASHFPLPRATAVGNTRDENPSDFQPRNQHNTFPAFPLVTNPSLFD